MIDSVLDHRPSGAGGHGAGRALAVLRAAAGPWARRGGSAVYLAFLAGGILVWQIARTPEKGAHAIVMLGAIGAALLWGAWFSRVLAVQVAGRSLRMPRTDSGTAWAIGLAALLTLLLPAALATHAGVDPRIAFGGLLAGAGVGMLVMLLPGVWVAGGIAGFGWLIIIGTVVPAEWRPRDWAAPDPWFLARQLPWLALALAALVAWRWRAVLAIAGGTGGARGRAAVLEFAHVDAGPGPDAAAKDQIPDWMWPAGQIEPAGPARPVRAMGAWLGTPFAPLSRRQELVQYAITGVLLLVVCVAVFGGVDPGPWSTLVLGCGLAGGLFAIVVSYGQRLSVVRRQRSAEWSELALLPGWGGAAAARGTLSRAVLTPLSQLAAGLFVLSLLALVPGGFDAADVLLVLLSALAAWLAALLGCLWPLSGREPGAAAAIALCLAGIGLPVASTVVAAGPLDRWLDAPGWIGLAATWCVALAWLLVGTAAAWRRFKAKPHAFLQD